MTYIPQLDGLRAVAVSAVLTSHFFPIESIFNSYMPLGRFGVIVFFVISGFLITSILLNMRDKVTEFSDNGWHLIRSFFIRRAIRIFPIYFATLFVCVLFEYKPVVDNLVWLISYLSNYSKPFLGGNYGGSSHLWSLSSEEQFYLLWPLLVICVRSDYLKKIIVCLIAVAILYKFCGFLLGLNWQQLMRPLPGCLESIGLGSLFALYYRDRHKRKAQLWLFVKLMIRLGFPAFIVSVYLFSTLIDPKSNLIFILLVDIGISMCTVWFIALVALNSTSYASKFLCLPWIRYIGKISYGIYIYHLFVAAAVYPSLIETFVEPLLPIGKLGEILILTSMTLVLASISWHLFEKPINETKRYFPY